MKQTPKLHSKQYQLFIILQFHTKYVYRIAVKSLDYGFKFCICQLLAPGNSTASSVKQTYFVLCSYED